MNINSIPVANIFTAWIVDFNNNKNMLEVGSNVFRCEGQGSWLLKHNGDDVISNVSLSEQLEGKINKAVKKDVSIIKLYILKVAECYAKYPVNAVTLVSNRG